MIISENMGLDRGRGSQHSSINLFWTAKKKRLFVYLPECEQSLSLSPYIYIYNIYTHTIYHSSCLPLCLPSTFSRIKDSSLSSPVETGNSFVLNVYSLSPSPSLSRSGRRISYSFNSGGQFFDFGFKDGRSPSDRIILG